MMALELLINKPWPKPMMAFYNEISTGYRDVVE